MCRVLIVQNVLVVWEYYRNTDRRYHDMCQVHDALLERCVLINTCCSRGYGRAPTVKKLVVTSVGAHPVEKIRKSVDSSGYRHVVKSIKVRPLAPWMRSILARTMAPDGWRPRNSIRVTTTMSANYWSHGAVEFLHGRIACLQEMQGRKWFEIW